MNLIYDINRVSKMKTTIKLITMLVLFFMTSWTKAQVHFGVQGMGTFSTISFTAEDDATPENTWKFGYGGGVFANIVFSQRISAQPSVSWLKKKSSMKQEYISEGGAVIKEVNRLNLNYLEATLPVFYTISTNKSWFIGGGPSIGYGISGKVETFHQFMGEQSYTEHKAFKSQNDNGAGLKRFDIGIYGAVGYRVDDIGSVQIGYTHGLLNIANTDDFSEAKMHNRSFIITLGYYLK